MSAKRFTLQFLLAALVALSLTPSTASASWTHLGGDPLFPGGIKGSGQTARNDFVKKSRTGKFTVAMRYAGLSSRERAAVKSYIVRGKFTKCTLNYGDHFVQESFGTNGTSVDRNVTFRDPRYKHHGAPAFCLSVKVSLGKGGSYEIVKIKVPWKCVNFGVMSKKKHKAPKARKPKPTSIKQNQGNSGQSCYSDNTGNVAGPGSVQGSCNNVVVICNGAGSCSPQTNQTTVNYEWCVQHNGSWNSDNNVCTITETTPPPSHECPAGSTWSDQHQQCEKDGSTTPPPPSDAPGTNPPPSSSDPAPGGSACYDETTGKEVTPTQISGVWLCPPGSYGTPVTS